MRCAVRAGSHVWAALCVCVSACARARVRACARARVGLAEDNDDRCEDVEAQDCQGATRRRKIEVVAPAREPELGPYVPAATGFDQPHCERSTDRGRSGYPLTAVMSAMSTRMITNETVHDSPIRAARLTGPYLRARVRVSGRERVRVCVHISVHPRACACVCALEVLPDDVGRLGRVPHDQVDRVAAAAPAGSVSECAAYALPSVASRSTGLTTHRALLATPLRAYS